MKLHLPVLLRRSVLSCIAAVAGCSMGGGVSWADNLTFDGTTLIWNTSEDNKSFTDESDAATAFTAGDNVSFTGESTVTLGEDITAGTVAIEQGAAVTIDLDVFELNVDRIELSGLLDMGYSLHIGEGTTLAVQSASAVLDSALVLGDKGGFEVGAAASLNNNLLTLQGNTSFILTAAGDGKTYTLLSGVSGLLDAQGNAISLDDTNNAASLYFDASQPGTGFWANGTLQLNNGALQMVLHNETVKEAITITSRQTYPSAYRYYAGIAFENISNDSDSYANGGAIYGRTITLSDNGSVTFSGNTASFSGGAIYGYDGSTITLSDNGSVTFSGNTASGSGGAICGDDGSTITLSDNGSVTFSGNTASSSSSATGGAIYGMYSSSTITLSNNGSVVFEGNTASGSYYAHGGAIYGYSSTITLSDNGSVTFSGNTSSSSSSVAHGGAIYGGAYSTITLSDNGSVTFSGNTASASSDDSAYGGAIDGSVTMTGNGDVTFSGNTSSSSDDDAYGGAIYGYFSSTITLNNNGSVTFSGNTASGSYYAHGGAIYGDTITLSDNGSVSFSGNTASGQYASGGAIYGSTIMLSDNGSVSFSGNTASGQYASGGAIYGSVTMEDNGSVTFNGNTASGQYASGGAISGSVTMEGNGAVIFSGNTASSSDSYANGGAISGSVTMEGNGSVTFSGNTASSSDSSAYGGAIYGSVTMTGNGAVSFSWNTASSSDSSAYGGGAILGSTITLSNNGSVTFNGNTATAGGGAIDGGTITLSNNGSVTFNGNTATTGGGAIDGVTITLSNNGSVTFSGNVVSSTSSYASSAHGGAIYGYSSSTITLNNNGSVTFSGNTVSSSASSAFGGAIYASGDLSIRNNDSVLFEKNVEKSGSTYRLRSIYTAGGSGDAISLSAAAGKSIEFRDSVYIASGSTVNLNADYTYLDEAGESVTIRQTGDIIFTGADTEQYLNDLLEAARAGRTARAAEIQTSRTTEVNAMTNLFGGRLRVEDGAIYQGMGITAMEGSAATVRVQNATLKHSGYDLTFNAGTALEVAGNSTIRGNVGLLADSLFKLEQAATLSLHETLQADAAELTVQGAALLAGSSTLNASLTLADGATLDMMSLDAGAVTINGALTFGGQVEMGTNLMAILNEMRGWEESVTLFTGIESLVLPQVVTSGDSGLVWVGNVFSNLAGNESYYIDFKADVGALLVVHVPEPTTTVLSMLALSSLVVRRRRK